MSLQTFKNLTEDRQKQIREVAYREFAFNTYKTASVSNIVKILGVAKGSFYRYFENKTSLYAYLIDYAYHLRMEQLNELLENRKYNFFDIVRENFRNKIRFDMRYPLESIFLYNVLQESNTEEVKPFMDKLKTEVLDFTKNLVVIFQKNGDLNSKISPELAAHLIYQSLLSIYDYLSLNKGIDIKQSVRNGHLFSVSEEEIMEVVDDIVQIIKSGLSQKQDND